MKSGYDRFLGTKEHATTHAGVDISPDSISAVLYPFQRAIVRWAAKKGRCAIFADCGMGKTLMQLEWARLLGKRTLIIAPLCVGQQTIEEAKKLKLEIEYTKTQEKAHRKICITNYENIEKFEPDKWDAVILDESSILKSLDGKTRTRLIRMFRNTAYRLCCTATPAPNDISEIANHAEFLGIMTREEMLATYFVHDEQEWRLKGHAEDAFWKWLVTWSIYIKKPSDIGFSDDGYILPKLSIQDKIVNTRIEAPEGYLFMTGLKGIGDRAHVRRQTVDDRVTACKELVDHHKGTWLIWCGLNDESRIIARTLGNSAIEVTGQDTQEQKISALQDFLYGKVRVLVTKPKIAGFGMNFQHCSQVAFLGMGDSYEQYYQCIRRCWRFGQKDPVKVWLIATKLETEILVNIRRKEQEAETMSRRMIENMRELEKAEVSSTTREREIYKEDKMEGEKWQMYLGDCMETSKTIASESIDLSVFSPPFASLYVYSNSARDMGNSRSEKEFFAHFDFLIKELLRIIKPGRLCCVHVAQIPAMKARDGYIGLKDFRGNVITAFSKSGWIFHREVCIDKDPQAQAIRTHSKALLFVQMEKDSTWCGPALADYVLFFRKPGENDIPVKPDITRENWIEWARPIWYGISESDTLSKEEAREEKDERHICPLQLGTIERCIRLWSNKGETVFSPFAGIGSEGYEALRLGRKFIGVELKKSYWQCAVRNLQAMEAQQKELTLF